MILIKAKATEPAPNILLTDGNTAKAALEKRYDAGERNFKSKEDFDGKIYGSTEVKDSLIRIQGYKCCFCESKIGHIDDGDVEHYRPKAGWIQNDEAINKPGYYWLAYEWDNLLLSCGKCNQRFKKIYFPLINNKRALSHHHSVDVEEPVFIHPGKEDVEALITFKEEIPVEVDSNIRGSVTIIKLGLNRSWLNEQRREKLDLVRDIYDLAKGYPETLPELKQQAKEKIQKYYDRSLLDTTEYASMLRSFFRNNPIDF